MAFCIGNALIQAIGNSTINWIKSGFNGNPAFVNNPQQFFTNIADQQTLGFASAFQKANNGISDPGVKQFQQQILQGIMAQYNNSSEGINNNIVNYLSGGTNYSRVLLWRPKFL